MSNINVNGNNYSDDGTSSHDMRNGGHRKWLLPMLSDAMADMVAKIATALGYSNAAASSATAAAASASSALTAPGTSATSTTSLAIGTGSKTLTIQTGKSLSVGQAVLIANTAAPATNWMWGQITAYNSGAGSLTVSVTDTGGSGTLAAWTVSLSATPKSINPLPLSGGTMTGALNGAAPVTLASAATVNIGAAAANQITITGTTTITAFDTIAAGAERTLTFSGALTLTHNAASLILTGAANITTAAGDIATFVSLGAGKWRCESYTMASGKAVVSPVAKAIATPANVGALSDFVPIISIPDGGGYTLPDFTGYPGFSIVSPANAAALPAQVTTADGWKVDTGFSVGTTKILTASSAVTPHGTWLSQLMTPAQISSAIPIDPAGYAVAGSVEISSGVFVVVFAKSGSALQLVCIDSNTGTVGAPTPTANTFSSGNTIKIYADSASTFVIFGPAFVVAGSISGTIISLGTAYTTANSIVDSIKLTTGSYIIAVTNTTDLIALSVSGTTTSAGTAVASGVGSAGLTNLARINSTQALVSYMTGTSSPGGIGSRVATISGTAISLATASTIASGSANIYLGSYGCLLTVSEGASYIFFTKDWTTNTTGNWFGMTVSGTAVTIGSRQQTTNNVPAKYGFPTYKFAPPQPLIKLANNTWLFGHLSTGPFAVTMSGTTLTFGASGGPATTTNFVMDADTQTNVYAIGASAYDKLNVSGTTITSAYSIAVSPVVVENDSLTDRAVKYSGVWYAWNLSIACALTPNKWLAKYGTNYLFGGPVS